ncbi:unnamed protein product [Boreogadus saida]
MRGSHPPSEIMGLTKEELEEEQEQEEEEVGGWAGVCQSTGEWVVAAQGAVSGELGEQVCPPPQLPDEPSSGVLLSSAHSSTQILMCGHLSPYRLTLVTYDLFDTRPPLTHQHPNPPTPLLSNLPMR